jgi:hypothetical protein
MLAAGYVSWTAILNVAGKALEFVRQETEKAKASQDGLVDSRRRLAQVARNDDGGADLAAMLERADQAAMKFGVSRKKAQETMFSARSEGWEDDYEMVLQNSTVVDPTAAAKVAGQVPKLFAGTEQVSSEQAISGTLIAARQSRLDFEQIANSLPQAAAGAAIAGGTFAETAASLSVLADKTKSGDEAATLIKAFGTKLGLSADYAGLGIIGGYEMLLAAGDDARKEFLGESAELNQAFLFLSESMPLIKERTAAMADEMARIASGEQSMLDRQRGVAEADPAEQARLERNRAAIERERANESQFASEGAQREATRDRNLARMKEQGAAGIEQYAADAMGGTAAFLGAGSEGVAGAMNFGRAAVNPIGVAAQTSDKKQEINQRAADEAAYLKELMRRTAEEDQAPSAATPTPVTIPVAQPGPVTVPIDQPGPITVPVNQPGAVSVPVDQPGLVPVSVEQPSPVTVPIDQPGPVSVPVEQPPAVAVPVDQPLPVSVPVDQPSAVAIPIDQPSPVDVPVDQPPPVAIPIDQPPPVAMPDVTVPITPPDAVTVPVVQPPAIAAPAVPATPPPAAPVAKQPPAEPAVPAAPVSASAALQNADARAAEIQRRLTARQERLAAADSDDLKKRGEQIQQSLLSGDEQFSATIEELRRLRDAGAIDQETFDRGEAKAKEQFDPEARTEKETADEAARVRESLATTSERYEARIAELTQLRDSGGIDQETFDRGTQAAKEQYDEAFKAGQRLAEQGRRLKDSLMTAAEQYAATVAELTQLRDSGAIDQGTFDRAETKAAEEKRRREELENRATGAVATVKQTMSGTFSGHRLADQFRTGETVAKEQLKELKEIVFATKETKVAIDLMAAKGGRH